ncbi:MAG: glycosyltransferase family 4 protein, partial [Candidatus Helarchaeota archaeon]
MKKLCIITSIYPPDIGGPSIYSSKLKNSLEKLGFKVIILTFGDKFSINKKKKIIRIDRNYPLIIRLMILVILGLKIVPKYHIIYAQDPIISGLPAILLGKIFKKPVIFKIVGDFAWETARRYNWIKDDFYKFQIKNYSFKIWILKRFQYMLCRLANKIIVPSMFLKKVISNWGIPKKKIFVIYNSMDLKKITHRINELYIKGKKIKKEKGEIILLSIGRIVNWKRFDIIIRTMKLLNEKFKLFIVGDGPDISFLKNLSEKLTVSNRVYFLGRIDHDRLLLLYDIADILILLSEYEGYSHVLIEGLLKNKKIIASNIGGNPEIIKNYVNGLLIQNDPYLLQKAILKIINNEIKLTSNST